MIPMLSSEFGSVVCSASARVPTPTTVAGFPGGKAAGGVAVGIRVGVGTGVAADALREPVYSFDASPSVIYSGVSV